MPTRPVWAVLIRFFIENTAIRFMHSIIRFSSCLENVFWITEFCQFLWYLHKIRWFSPKIFAFIGNLPACACALIELTDAVQTSNVFMTRRRSSKTPSAYGWNRMCLIGSDLDIQPWQVMKSRELWNFGLNYQISAMLWICLPWQLMQTNIYVP